MSPLPAAAPAANTRSASNAIRDALGNRTVTMIGGVLWGFVVWIGMYYFVLPIVGLS